MNDVGVEEVPSVKEASARQPATGEETPVAINSPIKVPQKSITNLGPTMKRQGQTQLVQELQVRSCSSQQDALCFDNSRDPTFYVPYESTKIICSLNLSVVEF
jgi:hypothetical protein